jgi:acyl-CoA dehydrogenase
MSEWLSMPALWWVLMAAAFVLSAFLGLSRRIWVPILLASALGLFLLSDGGAVARWSGLLVVAMMSALAVVGPLRRLVITRPMMAFYRRAMPEISDTERVALDAGSTWWDAQLFTGRPDWASLMRFPGVKLSEAERAFLDGPVEELCAMLDDFRVDHVDRDLPPEAWKLIREQGFFGMVIPEEYGGKGFSQYGHAAVVMKIGTRSISAALTVMIPNSVGPAKLLLKYGTDAQKRHHVPRLARGEEIPCFALTAPDAGSDAGSVPDTGVICRQDYGGEKGVLGIRLNFDKRYITLGPVATLLGVAFQLRDPDGLLGGQEALGITLALVPGDAPGVEKGARHDPNRMAFMNGPVRGRNVFVPIANVIGGRDYLGQGWRMLMESLTDGRAISLPALSTAAAKMATRLAGGYARVREQFGVAIAEFEGIQEVLARLAGNTYAMDAARRVTLAALDEGHKPSVISAIVKYNLTDRARQCVTDAIEVHGGAGVCLGPRNPLGQLQSFPNLGVTVEGHNILTRTLITFGQGAIRCHPHLLDELNAVQGEVEGDPLKAFDRALSGHIGHALGNAVRALLLGLTGGRLSNVPGALPPPLRRLVRRVNQKAAAFAIVSDLLLLRYRGGLKRREQLSGRMADVLSQLYLVSCAVKHFHDRACPAAEADAAIWAVEDSLFRIEQAFAALSRNVGPGLGWLIRRLAFPLGRRSHGAPDRVGRSLAAAVSSPGPLRDALAEGMYLPKGKGERLQLLEDAMQAMLATAAPQQALRRALREGRLTPQMDHADLLRQAVDAGVIESSMVADLTRAEALRREVIRVDEFSAAETQASARQAV